MTRTSIVRAGLVALVIGLWWQPGVAGGVRLASGETIQLQGYGRQVLVQDPGGGTRPLWDGVHRLQDGSTITISNGILQSQALLPPTRKELRRDHFSQYTLCELLVRKVCGIKKECSERVPCKAAEQLLTMETEERDPKDPPSVVTPVGEQCNEAMADVGFFKPCHPVAPARR